MGPFAAVVTSVVPRARETAIAMGFAVDREVVTLASDPAIYSESAASRWWEDSHPFGALARVIANEGPHHLYAHAMAALWRDILTPLPEGASALVIGHSGDLEVTLVACMPHADHSTWGPMFGPCEGARLTFEGDPPFFSAVAILRV